MAKSNPTTTIDNSFFESSLDLINRAQLSMYGTQCLTEVTDILFRNDALSEQLYDFLYDEIKKNNDEANVLIDKAEDLIWNESRKFDRTSPPLK